LLANILFIDSFRFFFTKRNMNMISRRFIRPTMKLLAVAVFAGSVAAVGQDAGTIDTNRLLSVEACLQLAEERASTLANARRDMEIAGARVRQARAQAMPSVKLSTSYTRLGEVQYAKFSEEAEAVPLGSENNYSASASLNQLLYAGGSLQAAREAAHIYHRMASLEAERVRLRLERDTRAGFYGIILAERAVAVREESVRNLENILKQVEDRVRSDAAPMYEELAARSRLANERPLLIAARKNLQAARLSFRSMLNIEGDFTLSESFNFTAETPDPDKMVREALIRRPDIKALVEARNLRSCALEVALGDYQPTVAAWAGYDGTSPGSVFNGGNEWNWTWKAGITASWSLFDGGLRGGAVKEKRLDLEKADENIRQAREAAELETRQACLAIDLAGESLKAAKEGVILADKTLEIAETRYKQGLGTFLDLSEANLAKSAAGLNVLQAMHDIAVALADLELATGGSSSAENKPSKEGDVK